MPTFELVPLDEAKMNTSTGKKTELIKEYLGYMNQLQDGQSGKLVATADEKIGAIRRRLGAAAKVAGKDLVIKRVGNEIYFWPKSEVKAPPKRQRGRPRKNQDQGSQSLTVAK